MRRGPKLCPPALSCSITISVFFFVVGPILRGCMDPPVGPVLLLQPTFLTPLDPSVVIFVDEIMYRKKKEIKNKIRTRASLFRFQKDEKQGIFFQSPMVSVHMTLVYFAVQQAQKKRKCQCTSLFLLYPVGNFEFHNQLDGIW